MPAKSGIEIAANRFKWPLRTVKYSQAGTASPTGHRPDCSGFASMCLGLPTPGENTVTLVTEGHVYEIAWTDLQVGDLVMLGGPGTEGDNGHVMVVVGIAATFYTLWEQRGPTGVAGPTTRTLRFGEPAGYKPYRSAYLLTPEEPEMMLAHLWQDTTGQLWYVTGPLAIKQLVTGAQADTLIFYAGGAGDAKLPGFTLVDMRPFGKTPIDQIPGVEIGAIGFVPLHVHTFVGESGGPE